MFCAAKRGPSYLSFRDEDGDRVILARGHGKIRDALNAQLVPDLGQIVALVDLHLVCNDSGTELLVKGVLQVPARPRLLHEFAHGALLDSFGIGLVVNHKPDLEILGSVAIFILTGSLPCDNIGAQGREAEFVGVLCRKSGNDGTSISVGDAYSV